MDRFVVVALALLAGSGAASAPLPVCVVATAVVAVIAASGHRRDAWWVAAAFVVAALRGEVSLRQAETWAREAEALARPTIDCALRGRVITPVELRRDVHRATVAVESIVCAGAPRAIDQDVVVAGLPAAARRGDVVEADVRVSPVERWRNPGATSALPRIQRLGSALGARASRAVVVGHHVALLSPIDELRAHARAVVVREYAPDVESLGRALVLGESDLDPDDDAAFRATGLSHLLAVSGTHLVIAVLGVVAALRLLLVRIEAVGQRALAEPISALCGLPLTWTYAAFTGMTGSVFRAALMTSIALVAAAAGRRPRVGRVLGGTIVLGWAADPLLVFDVSFMLSLAATAGLVASTRFVVPRLQAVPSRALRALLGVTAATLAATLACAPVLATISPTLPVAGVALNLIAGPIGEAFGLPLSLAHVVLSGAPALGSGCAAAASGSLRVLLWLARAGADVGLALPVPPPTALQASLLGGAGVVLVTRIPARRWFVVVSLLGMLVDEVCVRMPPGSLIVTAIDVGQGDAILVELPHGGVVLVDAGGSPGGGVDPGARAVAPLLRHKRIRKIDVVVLSHPHPDHAGGLLGALAEVQVDELWDTGEAETTGRRDVVRTLSALRVRGTRIVRPAVLCSRPRHVGGARIDVLAPCDPSLGFAENTNDNSFVVRVAFGARVVLLTGDAEAEEEEGLVARFGSALRADLLKVGHHGSATSSTASFVDAVSPRHAFVSCGVRNRFGHPRHQTLDTLAAHGVAVCRTDRDGACTFVTDGFGTARPPGPR